MKKLLAVLALSLAGSGVAFADGIPTMVDSTTRAGGQYTRTVFNDSGSALTSGTVVVWDNDDTEFDRNGYPYVNASATGTVDSPWTAGVTLDASCADQSLCTISIYGPTLTNMRGTFSEDTQVGSGVVAAGTADDFAASANTCALGMLMEDNSQAPNGGAGVTCSGLSGNPLCQEWVFINISCL